MNKRMVTHLIGLGLVGLSATGWAQESGLEDVTVSNLDRFSVQEPGNKNMTNPVTPDIANVLVALDAELFLASNFKSGQTVTNDSLISIPRSDLNQFIKKAVEGDNAGLKFYYSPEKQMSYACISDSEVAKRIGRILEPFNAADMTFKLAKDGVDAALLFNTSQAKVMFDLGVKAIVPLNEALYYSIREDADQIGYKSVKLKGDTYAYVLGLISGDILQSNIK